MFGSMIDQPLGTALQGIAQVNAYGYQAHVANINARIAQTAANNTVKEGQYAESAKRIQVGKTVANTEASQAAGSIDVTGGSAPKVREQIANLGDLDARTIRYNAAQKAYGFSTEAQNYRQQADVAKAGQQNAIVGTIFDTMGSFLSSASSAGKDADALQAVGAFVG
jgi:hypothetical protein